MDSGLNEPVPAVRSERRTDERSGAAVATACCLAEILAAVSLSGVSVPIATEESAPDVVSRVLDGVVVQCGDEVGWIALREWGGRLGSD
jgi:hypothetical protein